MKKKVVLSVAAAALIGTLAVGGTLAWFTDTETATNVVTTGKVDILWNENGTDIVGDETGLNLGENLVPGKTMPKKAYVKNDGKSDAYIRAKILINVTEMKGTEEVKVELPEGKNWSDYLDITGMKTTGDGGVWSTTADANGYYYYNEIVGSGKATADFMTSVTLKAEEMNNFFADKKISIVLDAEAIQADNIFADGETKSAEKAFEIVTNNETKKVEDLEK